MLAKNIGTHQVNFESAFNHQSKSLENALGRASCHYNTVLGSGKILSILGKLHLCIGRLPQSKNRSPTLSNDASSVIIRHTELKCGGIGIFILFMDEIFEMQNKIYISVSNEIMCMQTWFTSPCRVVCGSGDCKIDWSDDESLLLMMPSASEGPMTMCPIETCNVWCKQRFIFLWRYVAASALCLLLFSCMYNLCARSGNRW